MSVAGTPSAASACTKVSLSQSSRSELTLTGSHQYDGTDPCIGCITVTDSSPRSAIPASIALTTSRRRSTCPGSFATCVRPIAPARSLRFTFRDAASFVDPSGRKNGLPLSDARRDRRYSSSSRVKTTPPCPPVFMCLSHIVETVAMSPKVPTYGRGAGPRETARSPR